MVQLDKITQRKELLAKRKSLTNKEELDIIIQDKCIELIKDYKSIAIYMSLDDEVDTTSIIEYCFRNDISVIIPKVKGNTLEFYRIKSFDDTEVGNFNVREPNTNDLVTLKDIECFVIPLVGFDNDNNRLGYGKGYYDSVLKDVTCPKYGLAYKIQKVEKIETDKHDIRLDLVITE